MKSEVAHPRPVRHRRRKLLIVAGILVLGSYAAWHGLRLAADLQWSAYCAELEGQGEVLTYAELAETRPHIPDATNGARLIEASWDVLAAACRDERLDPPLLAYRPIDPREGVTTGAIERLRALREDHAMLVMDLLCLRDYPRGQTSPELKDHIGPVTTAKKLLQADAVLLIKDGDYSEAVQDIVALYHLGAAMGEDLSLGGCLAGYECDDAATASIELLLHAGELGADDLGRLARVVESRQQCNGMPWALRGERAVVVLAFEMMRSGERTPQDFGYGPEGIWQWLPIPDCVVRRDELAATRFLSRCVTALSGDLKTARQTMGPLEAELAGLAERNIGREILPIVWWRLVVKHLRHALLLDCARVMLAAERFRMDEGRLPESWDELVDRYLPAVPPDPLGDGPLGYRQTPQGIIVYSVGSDLADDGGQILRTDTRRLSLDVGLRLLHVDQRAFPLIEASEEPRGELPPRVKRLLEKRRGG